MAKKTSKNKIKVERLPNGYEVVSGTFPTYQAEALMEATKTKTLSDALKKVVEIVTYGQNRKEK